MILEARHVTAGYMTDPVLREVSIGVKPGTFTAVIGPNGSGKTTLLRVLLGLLSPSSGEVLLDGKPLAAAPRLAVARSAALVAQDAPPLWDFSALEAVLLGRHPRRASAWFDGEEDIAAARRALASVGAADIESRRVATLSGGQQQRVAIAAALAQEPRALLLDEPTANLDLAAQVSIYSLVRELCRARGIAALAVTHDVTLAAMFSDRVAVLVKGRIVRIGTPAESLTAEALSEAFGTPIVVTVHPVGGSPVVLPVPEDGR
ncbi:MAG: iron complex transport system ATP-binding [Planctomycetota bacterium]|nr:MAG: iron complex transport system ATP-binding [Planctomycetota bacterium]